MRLSNPFFASPVLAILVLTLTACPSLGQRAGVPIESERGAVFTKEATAALEKLRAEGKALTVDQVKAWSADRAPQAKPIALPAPATERLDPPAIAERARRSLLRIGWHYLCHRCEHWHTNLAGGYVVAAGGVCVTCEHVVSPNADMKEGYLIAQDADGRFHPVIEVLAMDEQMDVAVIRIAGGDDLPALPLNDQVGPGDAAFLLSDPRGRMGYFSAGMVNRFYWDGSKPGDPNRLEGARRLRINVSTDWAPGSSGAPVLDAFGNAICHVSRISTEVSPMRPTPPATGPATQPGRTARNPVAVGTQIVFHEGIPARGVRLLIESASARPTTKPSND